MKATLGKFPDISLADARRKRAELEASQGIDRVQLERAERVEAERRRKETLSVEAVLDLYSELHLSNLKNGNERLRQHQAAFDHKLSAPITGLKKADCQRAVDRKLQAGKHIMANRVRAAVRHFTSWCEARGYIAEDIAQALSKPTREVARDVVLSVEEIQTLSPAQASCRSPGLR